MSCVDHNTLLYLKRVYQSEFHIGGRRTSCKNDKSPKELVNSKCNCIFFSLVPFTRSLSLSICAFTRAGITNWKKISLFLSNDLGGQGWEKAWRIVLLFSLRATSNDNLPLLFLRTIAQFLNVHWSCPCDFCILFYFF